MGIYNLAHEDLDCLRCGSRARFQIQLFFGFRDLIDYSIGDTYRWVRGKAVHNGGPAEKAGIAPGDELVALDGLRVGRSDAEARTRRYLPGDRSRVTVFRGDELMTLHLRWAKAPEDTCYLDIAADADDEQVRRRTDWLQH